MASDLSLGEMLWRWVNSIKPLSTADLFWTSHSLMEKFTDCVVRCTEETHDDDVRKEWTCHRSVLSSKSRYFDRAFAGPFMEASTKEIVISEESPGEIAPLLEYIYTGHYPTSSATGSKDSQVELMRHARMYTLAIRFDTQTLKTKALERVYSCLMSCARTEEFVTLAKSPVIPYVYNNTPASDDAMRLRTCSHVSYRIYTQRGLRNVLFTTPEFVEILKTTPDFVADLVLAMGRSGLWELTGSNNKAN